MREFVRKLQERGDLLVVEREIPRGVRGARRNGPQGCNVPFDPLQFSEEVLTLELSVSANIYQRLSAALPGIVNVTCQPFVNHVIIQIEPQFEDHARQVMLSTMGAEPIWAKQITVVDMDANIYGMDDVNGRS